MQVTNAARGGFFCRASTSETETEAARLKFDSEGGAHAVISKKKYIMPAIDGLLAASSNVFTPVWGVWECPPVLAVMISHDPVPQPNRAGPSTSRIPA